MHCNARLYLSIDREWVCVGAWVIRKWKASDEEKQERKKEMMVKLTFSRKYFGRFDTPS